MSNNDLQRQVIHHLAEQGIPDDYNAWEAVKTQLERNQIVRKSRQHVQHGSFMGLGRYMRIATLITMLLILGIGMVFLWTPQGQVGAKNLFQLFWKSDSNVLSLPDGQPIEKIPPTKTPFSKYAIGLAPALTSESNIFISPTPLEKTEHGTLTNGLTISEAEKLAMYTIREPKSLPSGYRLTEVTFDSQTRSVQQIYKYFPFQSGEMFVLTQEPLLPTDSVGQSANIEQIQVGDITVEAVNGSWFSAAGSNQEDWNNSALVHTFRWQQDGYIFTLQFRIGETFSPAYLSTDDMQDMLEIVIGARSEYHEKVNLNNLYSIDEAEQISGFHLLAPTILPEGFILEQIVYEPENKRAVFIYQPKDTANSMNHPSLIVIEILISHEVLPTQYPEILPADAVEQVMIGKYSGTFKRGEMVNGKYDPSWGISLYWETKDLSITINYADSPNNSAQLEKADLIKIAESLQ